MKSCFRIPWTYIFLGGLVITLILAYFFQWKALLSILPWLFILACPLMHLMGGHGNHSSHNKSHDDRH
ncbi:MAG TPA: DUF2933 domain-containing protein [Candidatus Peribacterales bacterium]|nr:DUF2933 domain-containing protein [Candidatus Peribacterales bacterium]